MTYMKDVHTTKQIAQIKDTKIAFQITEKVRRQLLRKENFPLTQQPPYYEWAGVVIR